MENLEGNIKPISYRIITLGNEGVYNTSIFHSLLTNKFQEIYNPTMGLIFKNHILLKKNTKI